MRRLPLHIPLLLLQPLLPGHQDVGDVWTQLPLVERPPCSGAAAALRHSSRGELGVRVPLDGPVSAVSGLPLSHFSGTGGASGHQHTVTTAVTHQVLRTCDPATKLAAAAV